MNNLVYSCCMAAESKEDTVTLEILQTIEENAELTQRHLSDRLGVALGLTNSYLKRCIRKGLVKIKQAPSNRYLYYLTPKGFAEKSRLTAQYLSYSFEMYRRASRDYNIVMQDCGRDCHDRIILLGVSELAEIALLRAQENGISVAAIHDPATAMAKYMKLPVRTDRCIDNDVTVAVLTAMNDRNGYYRELINGGFALPVIVPAFLSFVKADGGVTTWKI